MRNDHELLDDVEAGELAVEYDDQPPETVLAWALERYGSRIALCTSFQAEGMVLLDMAWRIDPKVRVFTIDTGRMHHLERFVTSNPAMGLRVIRSLARRLSKQPPSDKGRE